MSFTSNQPCKKNLPSELVKISKSLLSLQLCLTLATSFLLGLPTQSAIASPAQARPAPAPAVKPKPNPPAAPPTVGGTIHVNPASIRDYLLNQNSSILTSLYDVYSAKEQINVARGNILPSLNLGAAVGGGSGFFLSAVSFLLPFLIPGNWSNLKATEAQFAAEGSAFYLIELNDLASALSAYTTIVGDVELRDVLAKDATILKNIQDIVAQEVTLGMATPGDLAQATSETQIENVQVSQTQELVDQEIAAVRKMMSVDLSTKLIIDPVHINPTKVENESMNKVAEESFQISPEHAQLTWLLQAARDKKWSAVFGFINGATVGANHVPGGAFSLSNAQATGSFNIGFGLFPNIKLAQTNISQLQEEDKEIHDSVVAIIEAAYTSVQEAKNQLTQSKNAETNAQKYLAAQLQAYRIGATTLFNLLNASEQVTTASIDRVKAQIDLDGQRINLARALLTDEFANVPKCDTTGIVTGKGGILDWFKGMFGSAKADQVNVDEICRPNLRAPPDYK